MGKYIYLVRRMIISFLCFILLAFTSVSGFSTIARGESLQGSSVLSKEIPESQNNEMSVITDVYNPIPMNVSSMGQFDPTKQIIREATEKRTSNSKHYLLADGSYQAVISFGDQHYLDEEGKWQEIKTDLIDESNLGKIRGKRSKESARAINEMKMNNLMKKNKIEDTGYSVIFNSFYAKLPKTYSTGYSISKNNDLVTFIPMETETVTGTVYSKDSLLYKNAWPNVDAILAVTEQGIKETLILKNEAARSTFSFEVQGNLTDALSTDSFMLEPAWLMDAKGERRDVNQTLRRDGSKTYLDLTANTDGLQYPILVDPTITLIPQIYAVDNNDEVITRHIIDDRGFPMGNDGGAEWYYLVVPTDTAFLPVDSVILSAHFKFVYCSSSSSPNIKRMIRSLKTPAYSSVFSVDMDNSQIMWFTLPQTNIYEGIWADLDITEKLKYNISKGYKGLFLSDGFRVIVRSQYDPDVAKRPMLVINYNSAPTQPGIQYPTTGSILDGASTISWLPSLDQEQSNLQYKVELSIDGGTSYPYVIANLTASNATSVAFDFSSIPNSSNSYIRITAYDGYVYGTPQVSAKFSIYHNKAPNAPTGLRPGNASSGSPQFVTTTTPVLNWSFSDPDTGDIQGAYNVVIFNASNSAVYDTNWTSSGVSSLTLPSNVLARGSAYSWYVRTKDSRGAVSSFSNKSYFKVNSLPTLTLTSYTDGQTILDNKLRMTWNYADGDNQPQTAYQVRGSRDQWATIGYDSGQINGTANYHDTTALTTGGWNFSIRVYDGYEWSNWQYRNNLSIPSAYEPNDTNTQAFPISYKQTYSSFINTATDIDFYKYTAASSGIDRFNLTVPAGINFDAYIYDANMNLVALTGKGAGLAESALYEVTAGAIYYIKIVGVGGAFSTSSTYSFNVNKYNLQYQTNYQYDSNGNIIGKSTNKTN